MKLCSLSRLLSGRRALSLLLAVLCLLCAAQDAAAGGGPPRRNYTGNVGGGTSYDALQPDPVPTPGRTIETTAVGAVVRKYGEEGITGLVLMSGLEEVRIEPFTLRKPSPADIAKRLANLTQCSVQEVDGYHFIYPQNYEILTQVRVPELHPAYNEVEVEGAFGAGLPLYLVLAWLGQASGTNVVADDIVAEATSGEIVLSKTPFRVALEAILKSARAVDDTLYPNGGFKVDSTDEYVFLYHGRINMNPASLLSNAGELTPEQREMLDRRVNVRIPLTPSPDDPLPPQFGADTLAETLRELGPQLGVRIGYDKALADLPVNPIALTNVRVGAALDLIIRRWVLPGIVYQVREDNTIIIRRANPPGPTAEERAEAARKKAEEEAAAKKAAEEEAARKAAEEEAARKKAEEEVARKKAEEAAAKKAAEEEAARKAAEEEAARKKAEEEAAAKKAEEEAAAKKAAEEEAARKAAEEEAARKKAEEEAAAKKAAEEEAARKAAEEEAARKKAEEEAARKAAEEEAARKKAEEEAAAKKAEEEAAAKKAAEEKPAEPPAPAPEPPAPAPEPPAPAPEPPAPAPEPPAPAPSG